MGRRCATAHGERGGETKANAAIAGIAEIPPRRDTGDESVLELLSRVADLTVHDAGISLRDVDGLIVHDVRMSMGAVVLVEMFGLRASFVEQVDHGGATGAAMIARAAMAVATGACTSCLCLTASTRGRTVSGYRPIEDRSPAAEFEEPYGGSGANYGYAMIARRYMHEYAVTPEQLATIAVQHRANACANPDAIFYGKPLSIADVLDSPLVVDPLHLLEIVMPTGGAAGVLVTTQDRAKHLRQTPIPILGVGEHVSHWSATYAPDLTTSSVKPAADRAFAMAGISPRDIDLLSVYDCYTITVLLTLEDAGFCAKGAAGRFVEEHDLRWNGDLPTNTHGGQLSYGQSGIAGGMSHVTEAVRQLQGRAEGRQVSKRQHAFVHGNGGIMGEQVSLILGGQS